MVLSFQFWLIPFFLIYISYFFLYVFPTPNGKKSDVLIKTNNICELANVTSSSTYANVRSFTGATIGETPATDIIVKANNPQIWFTPGLLNSASIKPPSLNKLGQKV